LKGRHLWCKSQVELCLCAASNRVNPILIETIAKGHRWQAQIESGEYASLEDLARAVGLPRRSRKA